MNDISNNYTVRSMNTITIKNVSDLEELFLEPICLSGEVYEEIEKNAWHIMLAQESNLQDITIEALENFFNKLIQIKEKQLDNQQATLYVWFDAQSSQLCFNIISGIVTKLPFGAKLNKVPEVSSIIRDFLNLLHDNPFSSENITFFDADDEDFDWDAYEEEFERNFVLDVYVRFLNETSK